MKTGARSFALRRLYEEIRRPTFPVIMVSVIVILGLSGPFSTIDVMTFWPRLVFWAFVAICTYIIGSFVGTYVFKSLEDRDLPYWVSPVAIALATALGICVFIHGLNFVVFETPPDALNYYAHQARDVMIVSAVIALALHFLVRIPRERAAAALPPQPPLLDRLDADKRGDLISISVQDHYVEVVTTNGSALILMRMGDAVRETGETPGLRVHRSHWVATAHVKAVNRDAGRTTLTVTGGRIIPVSRSHLSAVQDAGFQEQAVDGMSARA